MSLSGKVWQNNEKCNEVQNEGQICGADQNEVDIDHDLQVLAHIASDAIE